MAVNVTNHCAILFLNVYNNIIIHPNPLSTCVHVDTFTRAWLPQDSAN